MSTNNVNATVLPEKQSIIFIRTQQAHCWCLLLGHSRKRYWNSMALTLKNAEDRRNMKSGRFVSILHMRL